MQQAAELDFETRSTTDLRKSGVYRYAEDEHTLPWGFSYRLVQHGPVYQWRWGYPEPTALLEHIRAGGIVKAHNAAFERIIWNKVLLRHLPHWPKLTIKQMDCTMARAAAIAHPMDLENLAIALQCTNRKDSEGHRLMMQMAKPRKFWPDGRIEWWDEPDKINRLMDYCDQDVIVEAEADEKLPPLTESERKVWMYDQTINDRGIRIDLNAVERCNELVSYAKKQADKEMRNITGRAVPKCTNDNKLIEWIASRGIDCTTVKKSVQDDLIFMSDLNGDTAVKDAIELRRASKKTSTAKYKAMLACVCKDSRIRGLLAYHGAGPGRWAGRLVQPQNFPRVDYEKEGYILEWLHELLADQTLTVKDIYDAIVCVHGPQAPLMILSRALRSMIVASPGHKLIGGDFANIEGRINAWLAGEEWKVQAFRDYDAGTGPDLYNIAYAKSFGIDVKAVTKENRQIGKVEELALGYQGSVGAFIDMGDTYGLNPYDISNPIYQATSPEQWDQVAATYAKEKNKFGLQEKEWTAIKVTVINWRKANPAITQSWWDYQDAAIEAVDAPGHAISCAGGRVLYYCDGRSLWCVLPCGRMLHYAAPHIETEVVVMTDKFGQEYDRVKKKVAFMGRDSETGRWHKHFLYGGLQCENIVQGTARDVMVDRMFPLERKGYPIILTVHDEIVAEPPENVEGLNDKDFQHIMSILPQWANGLPLAAKAWEDKRYVK